MNFRAGDLLAFAGRGFISNAIKLFTCSRFSHVGGIATIAPQHLAFSPFAALVQNWSMRELLIESTTLVDSPCVLTGRCIKGVQAHEPASRIESYDGSVWLLRLSPDWSLDGAESSLLTSFLLRRVGLPYPHYQAAWAAGSLMKRWFWHPEDFHYVFCSQLWTGALERVGRYPLTNAGKVNPGELVWALVEKGTYLKPERIK